MSSYASLSQHRFGPDLFPRTPPPQDSPGPPLPWRTRRQRRDKKKRKRDKTSKRPSGQKKTDKRDKKTNTGTDKKTSFGTKKKTAPDSLCFLFCVFFLKEKVFLVFFSFSFLSASFFILNCFTISFDITCILFLSRLGWWYPFGPFFSSFSPPLGPPLRRTSPDPSAGPPSHSAGPPKNSLFSLFRHNFLSFSLGWSSRGTLVVFLKRGDPQMCTFGLSGWVGARDKKKPKRGKTSRRRGDKIQNAFGTKNDKQDKNRHSGQNNK